MRVGQHFMGRPIERRVSTMLVFHEALHAVRYDDASFRDSRPRFFVQTHKGLTQAGLLLQLWPFAMRAALFLLLLLLLARSAAAGPPFVSDDPEPTDYKHFEIYAFNTGTTNLGGTAGQAGIDFNYGALPDLQLTVGVPAGFERPADGSVQFGLSNIQFAAKYRFLHQD